MSQQQKRIKKGFVTFNQNAQIISLLQEQSFSKIVQNKIWKIYFDPFKYRSILSVFFQQMLQSEAEQVWLDQNKTYSILMDISHIKFTHLKTLSLFGNQINNVEPISWTRCPNLQIISLCQNKITRINCFKKLYLQNLNRLYLRGNPIIEVESLTKTKINQIQIQKLILELIKHRRQDPIGSDLSFLAKLATALISVVNVRSNQRIFQDKVETMLSLFCLPQIHFQRDNI